MAEDKVEPRELNWRQLLPWTLLFQGFRVALDPNKLLLAAAGIIVMSCGWWLLSIIFHYSKPNFGTYNSADYGGKPEAAWKAFQEDLRHWTLLHEAAGPADSDETWGPDDVADTPKESERLTAVRAAAGKLAVLLKATERNEADIDAQKKTLKDLGVEDPVVLADVKSLAQIDQMKREGKLSDKRAREWKVLKGERKPSGLMNTWPWEENRGPNPYLLITGQAGDPWEIDQTGERPLIQQCRYLVEPLVKLFRPVLYFFNPNSGTLTRLYALLVMVWTLLVWGLFGGAITRIAAVQVTRQEKVGLLDALRFASRKYLSYISAPLFPLVFVALLLVLMILFGWVQMIPWFGDIVDALLWWVMILLGLGMAVVLIGLVGWPLMSATISTEGTDSWEAVSRSYSYVYQAPWQYVWYSLVALAYGAVVVFFVGLVGSLTVYLSKWGVSLTPGIDLADRNPSFLFVYAPESFGWRALLLQGTAIEGLPLVEQGKINAEAYLSYLNTFRFFNQVGAVVVSILWVGVLFMLILGFGYSYFWSACTIIYLLMRRKVDDTELDEVYLEEEEGKQAGGLPVPQPSTPASPPPSPQPAPAAVAPPVAEPPQAASEEPSPPPTTTSPEGSSAPTPTTSPPPATGDGNSSPAGGESGS
jgi:hypothetical protein